MAQQECGGMLRAESGRSPYLVVCGIDVVDAEDLKSWRMVRSDEVSDEYESIITVLIPHYHYRVQSTWRLRYLRKDDFQAPLSRGRAH